MSIRLIGTTEDIIPAPSIGLGTSISIFEGSTHRQQTRYSLENLNQDAENQNNKSENLLWSLKYLRELLYPTGITK